VPATIPALSDTPGSIRWLGQALGADTDDVLADVLGRTADQITELRTEGVI
jgi:crotonobetainyl-CoA:carnitine CoA-transferase CaiB-like acyl-CoA transferase